MALLGKLMACYQSGLMTALDYHFARFIATQAGEEADEVILAAALVSHHAGQGDVCIELGRFAGKALFGSEAAPGLAPLTAPRLARWRKALSTSRAVGKPGERTLLILDEADRLYLARFWRYEDFLARDILARAVRDAEVDRPLLQQGLQRLFNTSPKEQDWQRIAAAIAVLKPFVVISGGPGTGKTTTVTKLLILLAEQFAGKRPRIALAAPTGKAAARLSESIKEKKRELPCDDHIRAVIPEEATTLHRLIGVMPGRAVTRHHRDNPLHLDALVVDEASMIDLPMMCRLLDALPASARLILLGDKDQLASVEAGSVLGDLCTAGLQAGYSEELRDDLAALSGEELAPAAARASRLGDNIVLLRTSYRFDANSGIGALAQSVNQGDARAAFALFNDLLYQDLEWQPLTRTSIDALLAKVAEGFRHYLQAGSPVEALQRFNGFRVLCALREGPFGVARINESIEKILRSQGMIGGEERWYAGRPIMITRNHYGLKLFNGDIGMIWPDAEQGGILRAFFILPDGTVRKVLPNRLPEHETAYAMTVHKSQGSEFDEVVLILPDEPAPVVSRELIYTAITRAKRRTAIWGTREVFEYGVGRRLERASGLVERLRADQD
ncbi:MAG: exodeoxyribonuclease V subunit alpha [Pseudomonadota bacterium]